MKPKKRILWCYDHPTARYQEVDLFIEAGAEVVVSLGDPATLRIDRDYHNEVHALYPDWRPTVTLPADVLERVRRAPIMRLAGRLSKEDAKLINATIDVIIIPADPPVIANILEWFTGHLMYRANGAVNRPLFFENMAKVDEIAQKHADRFWFAPGMENLIPPDSKVLKEKVVFLPVWISPERMPFRWAGGESKPYITTAISYIDFHDFFYGQYLNIKEHLEGFDYKVLGKNNREALRASAPEILGGTDVDTLYGLIAQSRVFVDAVNVPEHLIFPPIEAMQMGVPVLFIEDSGLGVVGKADGYSHDALSAAGMFQSFADIRAFLLDHIDDVQAMAAIAARQRRIFMDHCFSRDRALENFRAFLKKAPLLRRDARGVSASTREAAEAALYGFARSGGVPDRGAVGALATANDSATTFGRVFRAAELRGETGRLVKGQSGMLVREGRPAKDEPGWLLMDRLPPLEPGRYRLTVHVEVPEFGDGEAVWFALGTFAPEGYNEVWDRVNVGPDGRIPIEGLTHHEANVEIEITPESVGHPREARLHWPGNTTVHFHWMRMQRL
jgi:hypothetical protein